jgi:uncharacterized cupredoxin-like copper-binding protein
MKNVVASVALALPLAVLAHGSDPHAAKPANARVSTERHPWGMQGDPKRAMRTVRVTMHDTMRFEPARFEFRRGETVTFVVHNAGRAMHEFVIGTEAELLAHAELMKQHPDMEHDAPSMAHVAPGKTQRLTWRFTEAGDFLAGCLVAGHWDAGMRATIRVQE